MGGDEGGGAGQQGHILLVILGGDEEAENLGAEEHAGDVALNLGQKEDTDVTERQRHQNELDGNDYHSGSQGSDEAVPELLELVLQLVGALDGRDLDGGPLEFGV